MAEIVEIPVEKIKAGDYALRVEGVDDTLVDLAASIRRVGVLVPLLVVQEGDSFSLVSGHRRLAAAKDAGILSLPCLVHEGKSFLSQEVALAENVFRKDLSPIELAAGIKDILERRVMDIDEVAHAMNRSRDWVVAQLDLLSWPEDVLEAIQAGWLSVSAGHNLALITDDTYRDFLLRNAEMGGVTARVTASWLQAWRASSPPEVALQAKPAESGPSVQPATPQAPCIVCGVMHRTDALSLVMVCCGCVNTIRNAGSG